MRTRAVFSACKAMVLIAAGLGIASAATGEETGTSIDSRSSWQQQKCAVFEATFAELTARLGTDDASEAFLTGSRAYIDSGCLADVDACPETEKDIAIANGLTIATMNAGAASTFSPFRCRAD